MEEPIIYIVDDDISLCDSLSYLLESVRLSVKVYHHADGFLENYDPTHPSCLLLDIRMPNISGLQCQDILNQRDIKIPIIFMTGHGDVSMAVRSMKKGAFDFMLKPFDYQNLLESINRAIKIDQEARHLKQHHQQLANQINLLSTRELDVLTEVAHGKSSRVIATEMKVSPKTIEYHRAKISKKLKAQSIPELVKIFYDYQKTKQT